MGKLSAIKPRLSAARTASSSLENCGGAATQSGIGAYRAYSFYSVAGQISAGWQATSVEFDGCDDTDRRLTSLIFCASCGRRASATTVNDETLAGRKLPSTLLCGQCAQLPHKGAVVRFDSQGSRVARASAIAGFNMVTSEDDRGKGPMRKQDESAGAAVPAAAA